MSRPGYICIKGVNKIIQKVTAFVVRERCGIKELLLFKHPTAGVQIPAGTVEDGEDIETAVKREVYEETADVWELKSDGGRMFMPYWTPLSPKPQIIPPQDRWLDFVYERI